MAGPPGRPCVRTRPSSCAPRARRPGWRRERPPPPGPRRSAGAGSTAARGLGLREPEGGVPCPARVLCPGWGAPGEREQGRETAFTHVRPLGARGWAVGAEGGRAPAAAPPPATRHRLQLCASAQSPRPGFHADFPCEAAAVSEHLVQCHSSSVCL